MKDIVCNMALTFITYNEAINCKSVRIHTVDNENSIRLLNWCRDRELYLLWVLDEYNEDLTIDSIISNISNINNYCYDYITICYLDDSHPDVVELKLSWL